MSQVFLNKMSRLGKDKVFLIHYCHGVVLLTAKIKKRCCAPHSKLTF